MDMTWIRYLLALERKLERYIERGFKKAIKKIIKNNKAMKIEE